MPAARRLEPALRDGDLVDPELGLRSASAWWAYSCRSSGRRRRAARRRRAPAGRPGPGRRARRAGPRRPARPRPGCGPARRARAAYSASLATMRTARCRSRSPIQPSGRPTSSIARSSSSLSRSRSRSGTSARSRGPGCRGRSTRSGRGRRRRRSRAASAAGTGRTAPPWRATPAPARPAAVAAGGRSSGARPYHSCGSAPGTPAAARPASRRAAASRRRAAGPAPVDGDRAQLGDQGRQGRRPGGPRSAGRTSTSSGSGSTRSSSGDGQLVAPSSPR